MFSIIRNAVASRKSDEGASAVEYGLLVAAIAAVIVAVVFVVGGYVEGAFNDTCTEIAAGGDGTATNANGDTCPQ